VNPYYVYFIIFTCIAYLIVTDASIARLIVLLMAIVRVKYERVKWWVIYSPTNPIVKYILWKRAEKIARQLRKEFIEKQNEKD
jgi:hypothetical protein